MGRPTKIQKIDLAYIAGFLDGDGSVMIQIKQRKDTTRGWRIMFTICFYQDTRHEKPLKWIRSKLGIGYISRRNDGMTELRINGYDQNYTILKSLYPYLKFKKERVQYILKICAVLQKRSLANLRQRDRKVIANAIIAARKQSYQSGSKKGEKLRKDLKKILKF